MPLPVKEVNQVVFLGAPNALAASIGITATLSMNTPYHNHIKARTNHDFVAVRSHILTVAASSQISTSSNPNKHNILSKTKTKYFTNFLIELKSSPKLLISTLSVLTIEVNNRCWLLKPG